MPDVAGTIKLSERCFVLLDGVPTMLVGALRCGEGLQKQPNHLGSRSVSHSLMLSGCAHLRKRFPEPYYIGSQVFDFVARGSLGVIPRGVARA